MRDEAEATENYVARGVLDTNATDGDGGNDGATDLSSYERATSMAELLAQLGESRAVQVAEALAGTRSRTVSLLMPCHQHRERVQ